MEIRQEHLPLTRIEGTFFNLDLDNRRFIKAGVPSHSFSLNDMVFQGDHYFLPFDLFTEKSARLQDLGNEDIVYTRVAQLKDIAPGEMATKYNVTITELHERNDFEIMVNQERYGIRDKGVLPELMLFDKLYTVDLKSDEIRLGDHHLPLSRFHEDGDGSGLRYAYLDQHTHRVVDFDLLRMTEMPPANIVRVGLPPNEKLDPYFTASGTEWQRKTYLMIHPIEKDLEAKVIPLARTRLPMIITRNKEREAQRQGQQHLREWHRKFRMGQ